MDVENRAEEATPIDIEAQKLARKVTSSPGAAKGNKDPTVQKSNTPAVE